MMDAASDISLTCLASPEARYLMRYKDSGKLVLTQEDLDKEGAMLNAALHLEYPLVVEENNPFGKPRPERKDGYHRYFGCREVRVLQESFGDDTAQQTPACVESAAAIGSKNLPWRRPQIRFRDTIWPPWMPAPPACFDSTTFTPAPATHSLHPTLPLSTPNKHHATGRENFLESHWFPLIQGYSRIKLRVRFFDDE
ncbi:hypothetical protein GEV33_002050 [Tenebrio molitor]|uniref:Uncharacterized protein n=1 Tax=Tenebrio molitor TaxID=7067 RepID=A0A8J6HS62_TENMO|nr:hypothetical protein GEV33_002050 [Tenebrio molitor]